MATPPRSKNNISAKSLRILIKGSILYLLGICILYGVIKFYNPSVHFSFLLPFIGGGLIGEVVTKNISKADIRNRVPFISLCFISVCFCFCLVWIIFLSLYAGSFVVTPYDLLATFEEYVRSGIEVSVVWNETNEARNVHSGVWLKSTSILEFIVMASVASIMGWCRTDY